MKKYIETLGYTVEDINNRGYQFRVNQTIDIYPKSQKYFNLKTKEWGTYSDVAVILSQVIPRPLREYLPTDTKSNKGVRVKVTFKTILIVIYCWVFRKYLVLTIDR
jgi:hypothetical protein